MYRQISMTQARIRFENKEIVRAFPAYLRIEKHSVLWYLSHPTKSFDTIVSEYEEQFGCKLKFYVYSK